MTKDELIQEAQQYTVDKLLKMYPNGFAVSINGSIYEIMLASSYLHAVAREYPLPPSGGGYCVTKPTVYIH